MKAHLDKTNRNWVLFSSTALFFIQIRRDLYFYLFLKVFHPTLVQTFLLCSKSRSNHSNYSRSWDEAEHQLDCHNSFTSASFVTHQLQRARGEVSHCPAAATHTSCNMCPGWRSKIFCKTSQSLLLRGALKGTSYSFKNWRCNSSWSRDVHWQLQLFALLV